MQTVQLTPIESGRRFETVLGKDKPVQVGDMAILADDSWPMHARGAVVGKVVTIDDYPDDPHLRHLVRVEPMRSLEHLGSVTVVVESSG